MNKPSYDKFVSKVAVGGTVVYDSSLVTPEETRDDIKSCGVPATQLANENGFPKLANCIMLGKLMKETGLFDREYFCESLRAASPKAKPELGEMNAKAFTIGYEYQD
jgi:2-oxoglutarate ferredoxin oxidoreductase subunit gamma